MSTWATIAVGLVVGLIIGLTSVGGGSLMTPVLIGVFRLHPAAAVGTDLVYQSVTRLSGSAMHLQRHSVDTTVLRHLLTGSIAGSLAASTVLLLLPSLSFRAPVILGALALVLIVTAATVALEPLIRARRSGRPPATTTAPRRQVILAGALVGLAVGATSVGAGSLTMTALVLLCPSLCGRRLVGTDMAHSAVLLPLTAITSSTTHLADWRLCGLLLIGSVPGSLIGGRLSAAIPDRPLRLSMAGVLLYAGLRLLPA